MNRKDKGKKRKRAIGSNICNTSFKLKNTIQFPEPC